MKANKAPGVDKIIDKILKGQFHSNKVYQQTD